MKDHWKSHVMTNTNAMNMDCGEGQLIITIKLNSEIPDDVKNRKSAEESFKKAVAAGGDCAGYMTIEAEITVGKITDKEIDGCDPVEYLKHGVIAGILDAIKFGLQDDRGINFQWAVEAAQEKGESAMRAVQTEGLLERLATLQLAACPTEGEA